ncbi:MAG TPA: lytic murein transglycosylase, partial [Bdellovibrionota bacterium]|nr:lytic murein transglycosylase [Bdellovibrionota bacterium]
MRPASAALLAVLLCLVPGYAGADSPKTAAAPPDPFERWKTSFVRRWGRREVPRSFIQARLAGVTFDPRVPEIDRNQITASTTQDYPEFPKQWLASDPDRVARGKEILAQNRELIDRVEKKYRV